MGDGHQGSKLCVAVRAAYRSSVSTGSNPAARVRAAIRQSKKPA